MWELLVGSVCMFVLNDFAHANIFCFIIFSIDYRYQKVEKKKKKEED
jgi:hypothetical protein